MPRTFSSADVHPRDRFAWWYELTCANLAHADCSVQHDQSFFAEMRFDLIGELRIAELVGAVQSVVRSPRHIAHDSMDGFALIVQHRDGTVLSQDGRDASFRAGDFALYDMTRPWSVHFKTGLAQTVILLPRSALLSRLGAAEPYISRSIDGASGVGGVLSSLLRTLLAHLDAIPASARERLTQNILDLVATALLSGVEHGAVSPGMTLVRAKLWIGAHLGEPLSAEKIASACRLSVRYLNRLFEREGTSLMHYVWERRLARCHRDLEDRAMRHRPIGDIAFAAGFNDLSHFSRSFRAHYGCAPSAMRRVEWSADLRDRHMPRAGEQGQRGLVALSQPSRGTNDSVSSAYLLPARAEAARAVQLDRKPG